MSPPKLLSIIVPVLNEEDSIAPFVDAIAKAVSLPYEVIFVVDPSTDGTLEQIRKYGQPMLLMPVRLGQDRCILEGLQNASGDYFCVMDVDLQDPPRLIPLMLGQLESGHDLVFAQRLSVSGRSPLYRILAWGWYFALSLFAGMPRNIGDFCMFRKSVRDRLVMRLQDRQIFFRGLAWSAASSPATLPFSRTDRLAGKSHYSQAHGSLSIARQGLSFALRKAFRRIS